MCKPSPAKMLNSVKRITHFNEKEGLVNILPALPKALLTTKLLDQIDIPPSSKVLPLTYATIVSIPPMKRNLSRCSQFPSEIVPGLMNEDELTISTYIDGFKHVTIFICKLCNTDHCRSTQEINKHIREVHKIVVRPNPKYEFEQIFECLS